LHAWVPVLRAWIATTQCICIGIRWDEYVTLVRMHWRVRNLWNQKSFRHACWLRRYEKKWIPSMWLVHSAVVHKDRARLCGYYWRYHTIHV
jgi:hypothetical protein